jgi:hypothetical protein
MEGEGTRPLGGTRTYCKMLMNFLLHASRPYQDGSLQFSHQRTNQNTVECHDDLTLLQLLRPHGNEPLDVSPYTSGREVMRISPFLSPQRVNLTSSFHPFGPHSSVQQLDNDPMMPKCQCVSQERCYCAVTGVHTPVIVTEYHLGLRR